MNFQRGAKQGMLLLLLCLLVRELLLYCALACASRCRRRATCIGDRGAISELVGSGGRCERSHAENTLWGSICSLSDRKFCCIHCELVGSHTFRHSECIWSQYLRSQAHKRTYTLALTANNHNHRLWPSPLSNKRQKVLSFLVMRPESWR